MHEERLEVRDSKPGQSCQGQHHRKERNAQWHKLAAVGHSKGDLAQYRRGVTYWSEAFRSTIYFPSSWAYLLSDYPHNIRYHTAIPKILTPRDYWPLSSCQSRGKIDCLRDIVKHMASTRNKNHCSLNRIYVILRYKWKEATVSRFARRDVVTGDKSLSSTYNHRKFASVDLHIPTCNLP